VPLRLGGLTVPQFRAERSNRCGGMAVFQFFKMMAIRHLGFVKVRNFNCRYGSEGQYASQRQILCRAVKPLRKMAYFLFTRWQPSASFDFKSWKFYSPSRFGRLERQCASSCQISCRSVKKPSSHMAMAIFPFFKMAAVRHIGFVLRVWTTHEK